MRVELGRRFDECLFEWVPYLYPDLDCDTSEADEGAAIEAGAINATGFLYVGTARWGMSPSRRSKQSLVEP
jgi:hypothetical protein